MDQLVPLAVGPITLEGARSLLGIADPRVLDSLLDDVLAGRASEALAELNRVYALGAELRQVVRGLMEGCRDRLVAALTNRDQAGARRLSDVLDSLLHLDGEVRRHAEPRFLVEATLVRLAVGGEEASTSPLVGKSPAQRGDGEGHPAITAPPAEKSPAPGGPRESQAQPPDSGGLKPADGEGHPSMAPQTVAGWSEVLEKLNRTVRAAYLDARPEVDGSTLILWFQYSFHHKKAQEQSAQLLPHVRAWLGDGVKVDYRLRDAEQPKAGPRTPASPEDDPFVREVVRRFEGRVTRVKEVSE
jgi:DNA polymerase III gamma/tau subunit